MPDVISDYDQPEGILYVKTCGNPRTPVPYEYFVVHTGDGLAAIHSPEWGIAPLTGKDLPSSLIDRQDG